ncbi:hypothetical protein L6R52_29810 [Myxococcota bacterium]|nr:hypothetical protein [Myxococcota bacterium]
MAVSLVTRAALLASALLVALLVRRFARGQNTHGKLGGAISRPKQLWLGFTVYTWFCVCPLLALDPAVNGALRGILGVFGASMWIRGIAELVMLYRTKNWRPPYGIGHDVLCVALVLGGLILGRETITTLTSTLDLWTLALVAAILVSLVLEIYYAYTFFHLVEGQTTGEEGVWFAHEEDPRFVRINRITAAGNLVLYTFLMAYLTVVHLA